MGQGFYLPPVFLGRPRKRSWKVRVQEQGTSSPQPSPPLHGGEGDRWSRVQGRHQNAPATVVSR
jgi:hypothetical protein